MKKYKKIVSCYHGTTLENAMSIITNGGKDLFFTTNKERAYSYGDVLIKKDELLEFYNRSDLYHFNKRMKNDFVDAILTLEKNKFVVTLINGKEEMTYFMCVL